jgi:hypothetical protein
MICPGWVLDTYFSQTQRAGESGGPGEVSVAAPAAALPWMAPGGLGPRLRSPARRPASPGAPSRRLPPPPSGPRRPRQGPAPGERGGRPAGWPRGCGTGGVGTAPLPHPLRWPPRGVAAWVWHGGRWDSTIAAPMHREPWPAAAGGGRRAGRRSSVRARPRGRSGRRAGPAAGPWQAGREYDIHVSEWGPARGGSSGKGGAPGWRCTVAYALRSVTSPGKRADGVSRPPLISLRCIQFVTQLKHAPVFVTIPRTCL